MRLSETIKNIWQVLVLAIITWLCTAMPLNAQQDSSQATIKLSAYAEVYYAYDFTQPENNQRPSFLYNFNRHNEVNLNLGFVKAAFETKCVRANLALMAGTYTNANLADEPGVLKNIFEANAGVKLSMNKDLWVDAGIFASHIGFESAMGTDCSNLTRSILAENSPYYEAGAKITYNSDNDKWMLSGLILNGWQRITRVDGNSLPSFGTQMQYQPNEKLLFNYSTFIGTVWPDSLRKMRYFNNWFGSFSISKKAGMILGFDLGWEQESKGSNKMNNWFSPILILHYKTSKKTLVALRTEYYQDVHGVIINTGTPNGFKTWGFSANFDVDLYRKCKWRIEGRTFSSKDKIFLNKDANTVNGNTCITTSLAVGF